MDAWSAPPEPPKLVFGQWHLGQELVLPEFQLSLPATSVAPTEAGALASIRGLLIALLVLAALYTVCLAKPVLVPLLLAAFLALCISPLVDQAERLLPRLPATIGVVALLLAALVLALTLLTAPAQDWLSHAPETLPRAWAKLRAWLTVLGEVSGTAPMLATVDSLAGAPGPAPTPWRWWEVVLAAPPLLVQAFSVILLLLFFVAYGGSMFRRAVELSPTLTSKKHLVAIVRAIKLDTARYFLTTAVINAALGSATAVVLWVLRIDEPLLWGAAVAVLNFIPYLGALVSVLLLTLVGVLQSSSPDVAVLPALCFLALAVLEGQFLSPLILGKRLSLSPVAILVWLMLWGWLWGIAGVILGVPMLMCLKLSCERLPAWRWLARSIE